MQEWLKELNTGGMSCKAASGLDWKGLDNREDTPGGNHPPEGKAGLRQEVAPLLVRPLGSI